MRVAVRVNHLSDEILAFFGSHLIWEEAGLKVYRDKYQEDHLIHQDNPFLIVDSDFDAECLKSQKNIEIPDEA